MCRRLRFCFPWKNTQLNWTLPESYVYIIRWHIKSEGPPLVRPDRLTGHRAAIVAFLASQRVLKEKKNELNRENAHREETLETTRTTTTTTKKKVNIQRLLGQYKRCAYTQQTERERQELFIHWSRVLYCWCTVEGPSKISFLSLVRAYFLPPPSSSSSCCCVMSVFFF